MPNRRRERMRLEELKRSPGGNMRDASGSRLLDLVNSFGWKGKVSLLIILIIAFIIISIFFI